MPERVVLEKDDDFSGRLNNFHWKGVKINAWQAGRSTTVIQRIVCFRERICVKSERGLGAIELRLAPSSHGRRLLAEFIIPVSLHDRGRPRMILTPDP
jgi:hypothetical protein